MMGSRAEKEGRLSSSPPPSYASIQRQQHHHAHPHAHADDMHVHDDYPYDHLVDVRGSISSSASLHSASASSSTAMSTSTLAPSNASTNASAQPAQPALRVYWQRWYVLAVFSLLSHNQSWFWLTFSPITDDTQEYFGISSADVNLLLNWGSMIYVPTIVFTFYLSTIPNGLRPIALAASLMCAIGMAIRCIPAFIDPKSTLSFVCLNLAHILNALAGPMVMAPVSQLSCVWFPVHERTTSTAIAVFSNWLGSAVGFVSISYVVTQPNDIPKLLYLHAGIAIGAALLVILYFPTAPPSPPSVAASQLDSAAERGLAGPKRLRRSSSAASLILSPSVSSSSIASVPSIAPSPRPSIAAASSNSSVYENEFDPALLSRADAAEMAASDASNKPPAAPSLRTTMKLVYHHFRTCISDVSTLCLTISGGILPGVYATWSALFDTMFQGLYDDNVNGWFGFVATIGAILGGILCGRLADDKRFSRRFMHIIIFSNLACLMVNLMFTFTVPNPWSSEPTVRLGVISMGALLFFSGFTMGMSSAVYYELAAEIAYPVPEAYSAGLLTCWNNLAGVIFIFLASAIPATTLNFLMVITVATSTLLLFGVTVVYRRKAQDENADMLADVSIGSGHHDAIGGGGVGAGGVGVAGVATSTMNGGKAAFGGPAMIGLGGGGAGTGSGLGGGGGGGGGGAAGGSLLGRSINSVGSLQQSLLTPQAAFVDTIAHSETPSLVLVPSLIDPHVVHAQSAVENGGNGDASDRRRSSNNGSSNNGSSNGSGNGSRKSSEGKKKSKKKRTSERPNGADAEEN